MPPASSRAQAVPARLSPHPGQGICEDGGGVAVAGVASKRSSSPALCTVATPVFLDSVKIKHQPDRIYYNIVPAFIR
jgi:hypothetical protein